MSGLDPLDQTQLVGGGDMVVLVGLQTLARLVAVEPEIIQTLEYLRVDRHRVEPHDDALHFHLTHDVVPHMGADFFYALSFRGVDVQNVFY